MKRLLQFIILITLLIPLLSFQPVWIAKTYVVTDFGAVGDGVTVNTAAIQQCIDQCTAAGGGTVIIPKGVFMSGAVFLKKKVNLLVQKDGTLKGTINQLDYPRVKTRWEGEEMEWLSALVNAVDLEGISLSGAGTIDGSGEIWKQRGGRPRLIAIQNCRQIKVNGLRLNNQASWGLFVLYSSNISINGLHITAAHHIPSSDGIDIDSSIKVHISDTYIDVNDDCISIKSGKDEDGLRVNRPAEEILIEKCHFGYGHGGVAMGSETSGGIRNVEVRDCLVDAGNWAPIRFKSQPSRGGVVENITYRNIMIKGTRKAFEFNMAWRMVNPKPAAKVLPVVRNIQIINVSGTADAVGDMTGLDGSPILGVKFINCNINAQKGFTIQNALNVDLSGLKITGLEGEAIIRK